MRASLMQRARNTAEMSKEALSLQMDSCSVGTARKPGSWRQRCQQIALQRSKFRRLKRRQGRCWRAHARLCASSKITTLPCLRGQNRAIACAQAACLQCTCTRGKLSFLVLTSQKGSHSRASAVANCPACGRRECSCTGRRLCRLSVHSGKTGRHTTENFNRWAERQGVIDVRARAPAPTVSRRTTSTARPETSPFRRCCGLPAAAWAPLSEGLKAHHPQGRRRSRARRRPAGRRAASLWRGG